MTLAERIDSDLKAALKNRQELRLQVVRMLKSDMRYKQIELGHELSDDEVVGVLSTAAKKRREAADEYARGGRQDLADGELAELDIIKAYLPEQLSEEDLYSLIDRVIAETGASSVKDIGLVMKSLMPEIRGRADGKLVNSAVRARLEQK